MISTPQAKAFIIVPKCIAGVSFIGSGLIIADIFRRMKFCQLRLTPRHRLLVGMSVCDLLSNFAWFMATWALPSSIDNLYWNKGNWATCKAQGFLIQLSLGTIGYNVSLSIYYFLVIRNRWTNEQICKSVEPLMHLVPWILALGTSSSAVALRLVNPLWWVCWIGTYPPSCEQQSLGTIEASTRCTRGTNAEFYTYAFFFVPLWIATILITGAMLMVYWKIHGVEEASSRFGQGNRQKGRFAMQALMYVGAFYVPWFLISVSELVFQFSNTKSKPWVLSFVTVSFLPMQGICNAIVYILPRYQTARLERHRRDEKSSMGVDRVTAHSMTPRPLWETGQYSGSASESDNPDFRSSQLEVESICRLTPSPTSCSNQFSTGTTSDDVQHPSDEMVEWDVNQL